MMSSKISEASNGRWFCFAWSKSLYRSEISRANDPMSISRSFLSNSMFLDYIYLSLPIIAHCHEKAQNKDDDEAVEDECHISGL